jgi:hypothetical protein
MKRPVAGTAVYLAAVAAGQLIWPSEWDELEAIYTMMGGYNRRGFIDGKIRLKTHPHRPTN